MVPRETPQFRRSLGDILETAFDKRAEATQGMRRKDGLAGDQGVGRRKERLPLHNAWTSRRRRRSFSDWVCPCIPARAGAESRSEAPPTREAAWSPARHRAANSCRGQCVRLVRSTVNLQEGGLLRGDDGPLILAAM